MESPIIWKVSRESTILPMWTSTAVGSDPLLRMSTKSAADTKWGQSFSGPMHAGEGATSNRRGKEVDSGLKRRLLVFF